MIEREVVGNPRVQQALNDMQLLRPDVTTDNADNQALMRRHQILGPPAWRKQNKGIEYAER